MDFLLNECFSDFDHFAAQTRAWQLDFVQLDRGAPRFELLQAGVGEVHLARASFNRRLEQRGGAPVGMRTFAISVASRVDHRWRGHDVSQNHVLVFPENGELSSVSAPGFDNIVLSVGIGTLERICEEERLPGLEALLGDREFVELRPEVMGELCREALAGIDTLKRTGGGGFDPLFWYSIKEEFARHLLVALAGACEVAPPPPGARRRSLCLSAAIEMIEDCGEGRLTVAEIVRAVRCSERTLQYAFREQFGIGPKAYLQAWRLNQVRRHLTGPTQCAGRIAEIANRHGFWHMGQFAADYRRMFGELPSETADRSRGSLLSP